MKITSIVGSELCRGIPLKGWDSVKAALQAYSEGRARGARATTDRLTDDVGQVPNGGLAVAITLWAGTLQGRPDAFVERMLNEAKEALRSRSRWHGSYDYDAMGTNFFKTSVDIELCDRRNEVYVLSIYAAYVGDKPEEGLAEFLGVPRALLCRKVTITTEPLDAGRFTFDFNEVYEGLGPLLGLEAAVGTKIAKHMMSGRQFEDPKSFLLKEDDDVRVTLSLGRVQPRFTFERGEVVADTWRSEGSTLTGFLADSYSDVGSKEAPAFVITVSKKPKDENQFSDSPVWDTELRLKMVDLANEIGDGMFNGWP